MNDRTLIKVSAGEHCIGFRTISRKYKSPREFLVTREALARLEPDQEHISSDGHSFAALRWNGAAGTLSINFSWLNCSGGNGLAGRKERVVLSYDALADFIWGNAQENGSKKWKTLSIEESVTPKIEVCDTDKLRQCIENRMVRRKLSRALRDNFRNTERVVLYHDFAQYSFMFQSFWNGRPAIVGGLILHGADNLAKAYYSVHT